jgi:hypothetical protein
MKRGEILRIHTKYNVNLKGHFSQGSREFEIAHNLKLRDSNNIEVFVETTNRKDPPTTPFLDGLFYFIV